MVRVSHSQAGATISLHRNPGVAGAPHPRTFPPNSQRAVLDHGALMAGRSAPSVWGGVLLSGGSTLFWVPILAYACSSLGAPAGPVFWFGFAAVMFGLGVTLWAVLQSGMRDATARTSLKNRPHRSCASMSVARGEPAPPRHSSRPSTGLLPARPSGTHGDLKIVANYC